MSHACQICDYIYSTKTNLKNHIDAVHEGKKPHKWVAALQQTVKLMLIQFMMERSHINARFVITAFQEKII